MKRRLIAAVVLAVLLVTILPAAASAYSGNCVTSGDTWRAHTGMRDTSSNTSRTGVSAKIQIPSIVQSNAFKHCNAVPTDALGIAMAWVALEPTFGCGVNCIIQLGIYRDPNDGLDWGIAFGGCNGHVPLVQSLGSVTFPATARAFSIWLDNSQSVDVYKFAIEGVAISFQLPKSHPSVSCWTFGQYGFIEADWFFERMDSGDSIGGSSSTNYSRMYDPVIGRYNLGWSAVSWNPSLACHYRTASDDGCDVTSSTQFKVWTNN